MSKAVMRNMAAKAKGKVSLIISPTEIEKWDARGPLPTVETIPHSPTSCGHEASALILDEVSDWQPRTKRS